MFWIYTVCKGRVYPCSAGQGLITADVSGWTFVLGLHCCSGLFIRIFRVNIGTVNGRLKH